MSFAFSTFSFNRSELRLVKIPLLLANPCRGFSYFAGMNQLFKLSILLVLVSLQACDSADNLVENLISYEATAVINGVRWDAQPGEVLFVNEVDEQTGITTLAILLNGDTSFFTFTVVNPEETT